MNQYSFI